jgi:hypothetical protein
MRKIEFVQNAHGEPDTLEGEVQVDDKERVHNPTFQDVENIVKGHSYKRFSWDADEADWPALMVDAQTANVLVTCYGAMESEATREKFKNWIAKGRPTFVQLVDFCWGAVRS